MPQAHVLHVQLIGLLSIVAHSNYGAILLTSGAAGTVQYSKLHACKSRYSTVQRQKHLNARRLKKKKKLH